MNVRSMWKWLPVFVLLLCLLPGSALAKEVQITNHTTKKIALAISYFHSPSKAWVCQGWWTVDALKNVKINLNTDNNTIYFVATSGKFRWGGKSGVDGAISLPVIKGKFLYKTKTEKPSGDGYRTEVFKMRKAGSNGKFAITFKD